VGLKSDLRTKRTCIDLLKTQGLTPVTPEQGQAVATRMGATYVECSSKEMKGVDRVFELAVNVVIEAEESSHYHDGADAGVAGADGGGGGSFKGGRKIKKRSCRIL